MNSRAIAGSREQVNRLGTGKVSKLMLEFAIPAIIGMVVNGLYNIIDSIFLGRYVGDVALAAVTVAMPLMIFSMAVALLVGAGGNALAALKLGEGKFGEAERVLGNSFILTIIVAIVATLLVNIFMDPVLAISGAQADSWESSRAFLHVISFGFILQFFGMGFNNFMRTAGAPTRATLTMVAGTVACIALNYLFVVVFHWGIEGSALATVLGQGLSAALVLWYFAFSKKAPFKIKVSCMRLSPRLVGSICSLGTASFVLQMSTVIISMVLSNQLAHYGELSSIGATGAQASIGLVNRVAMFAFFPIIGVAVAVQPLFGFNYGAQNYERVKTAFKIAFLWTLVIGVLFWLLVHLFPAPIVRIFGIRESLEVFTGTAMQVQMFLMPLIGLQVIAANYFQSTGQPLRSMFLSLTRQLLYLIPLMYLLPVLAEHQTLFPWATPLDAIYFTYPVADVLSVITASIMMIIEFRKLDKRIEEREQESEQELARRSCPEPQANPVH